MLAIVFATASAVLQAVPAQPRFALEPVPKTMRELEQRFTASQIGLLEKLNRRDVST